MESENAKKEHLGVPSGFRHLLENLTVEVLRVQPSNIYKFAAEYFKERLHERQGKKSERRGVKSFLLFLDSSPFDS